MNISPERQFDFWLGEWNAVWDGGRGTNRVEMAFDGKVVMENFTAPDLIGMSVSCYDPERNLWCQTWVDNTGSYLDFTGGFEDGEMILARDAVVNGERCKQRMVWSNIEARQFDWSWERSDDGGVTWQIRWRIKYTRK